MEGALINPIPLIQRAKHGGALFYSEHCLKQAVERSITTDQIEEALNSPDIVVLENYLSSGPRPPSCLVLGWDRGGRPLHAIVAYPTAVVVTSYEPRPPKWITPTSRGEA